MFSPVSRRLTGSAAAVCLGVVLITATSHAGATLDPGPARQSASSSDSCRLARVGTQFVRCDDLTGNGAPAPSFIPLR
jgi:hypothetical protein